MKSIASLRILVCALAVALAALPGFAQATFGTPSNLGAPVNCPEKDGSPSLTADGLELYFHSNRPGGQGAMDIYVAKRASTSAPWGTPQNLGPIVNGPGMDLAPSVTGDGLELIFTDYTTPRAGGQGKTDIWVTRRASRDSPWGAPENLGPLVNSPEDEPTPVISADGLELIFDSYRAGGLGYSDLYVSRRASRSAAWAAPVSLGPSVNSPGIEHCPTLTLDGLTMFFDCTPPNMASEIGDLMMTRRATLSSAWGAAVNLGHPLSTHYAGAIAPDGKSLYYTDTSPGGPGGADIWQVPVYF